jgi:hypothetical protein
MGLSKEAIEEFKKIYREEFHEEITDAQALEMGEGLLDLFEIIYRPIPENSDRPEDDNSDNNPIPA